MSKRYAVFFKQRGDGCDYTIACAQKFCLLPESVTSMEEAVQVASDIRNDDQYYAEGADETDDGRRECSLGYHGAEDIGHCVVYEISQQTVLNVESLAEEARVKREKEEAEREKEKLERRLAELEGASG